jgi:aldose 1-epimerase
VTAAHPDRHAADGAVHDGRYTVTLASPAGVTASFLPFVGMLGCSFTHDGVELLAVEDAGGVDGYTAGTSMCGVPLLHPWANRLSRHGWRDTDTGDDVTLPPDAPFVLTDDNGLPLHGLGTALARWRVTAVEADDEAARLCAVFDSRDVAGFSGIFPYPYMLTYDAALRRTTLTVTVTLHAVGDRAVPLAFGFHPYLRLPGVDRADWVLHAPVRTRVELDDRMLPTGRTAPVPEFDGPLDGPLGDRTLDDLFCDVHDGDRFTVSGGGRSVTVGFDRGWTHAVLWAPEDPVTVCFEPMTASIDPFDGPFECRRVAPGDAYTASFSISAARNRDSASRPGGDRRR